MRPARGLLASALLLVPAAGWADDSAPPQQNLDCAVIYTMAGQIASSVEERSALSYLSSYFIGLYEGQTARRIDDAFAARFATITREEVDSIGPNCKSRADAFDKRMEALGERLDAESE